MSRFERHLADDPLFVVIVDLIDSARLLPDTQNAGLYGAGSNSFDAP
jgi:hypothetical protein